MAAESNKFPVWIINSVLFFIFMSAAVCSTVSTCADGTYDHKGRKCCLCAAGQHLVKHCETNPDDRICDLCESDFYTSDPNNEANCDQCTSCSQTNDNLVEDEPCTPVKDRKCRCKEGHYCVSNTEICRHCQPCKVCGPEGIKVPCTGKNNTVCNDKVEGGDNIGIIIGVILLVVLVAGVAVIVWKRRLFCRRPSRPASVLNGLDVEMRPLRDVDLQPHLSDIAEVVGWKDMQAVALRSNITMTTIESCQLNHPGDAQEQTLELLNKWAQQQGMRASTMLIKTLESMSRRAKAEKVAEILHGR